MNLEDTAGAPAKQISAKTDQRILIAVSSIGLALFLGFLACAPGGFIFKHYNIPSGAMIPTLPVGSHVIVSRASYGYSRYSFDWLRPPIDGRFLMAGTPKRGDIAVFKLPRDGSTDYIKRIVGLPGDKVQMVNGRLIINGQMIAREPIAKVQTKDFYDKVVEVPTYRESLRDGESHRIIEIQGDTGFNDNTKLFEVPADHYFVMGDNRDNSTDSRVPPDQGGVGFVPLENFVGPVVLSF